MTLSPFDDMMLAVVAVKVLVALLFLRWFDTSPKQTEATAATNTCGRKHEKGYERTDESRRLLFEK
jgi:hypothetical protein